MNELWSSFSKWFEERANSPLYWSFIFFFVTWNWKFFQIIFLEHESLFSKPRSEYIDSLQIAMTDSLFVNWVLNFGWHIIPPLVMTYFAIVYLPKFNKWAFDIHLTHYFERNALYQTKKAKHEEEMAKLVKQEAEAKKERVVQEGIIEKIKSPEEKWKEELEQVKRQDLLIGFQKMVAIIYKNRHLRI